MVCPSYLYGCTESWPEAEIKDDTISHISFLKKCVCPSVPWPSIHQICLAQNSIHAERQDASLPGRGVFEPKFLGQQAKTVSQRVLCLNDFSITYVANHATNITY